MRNQNQATRLAIAQPGRFAHLGRGRQAMGSVQVPGNAIREGGVILALVNESTGVRGHDRAHAWQLGSVYVPLRVPEWKSVV